jgi:predicted nucleic-acid-binding protein
VIGLDTNVIVRYITLDDPVQTVAAVRLIDSLSSEEPGFISLVVMAELGWVLQASYNFEKAAVVKVFDMLLRSKELVLEQADVVSQAVGLFAVGNSDFADCLIERSCEAAGCLHTFTFDRKAASSARMQLLK